MTPVQIEVLLHVYYNLEPYPKNSSKSVLAALNHLNENVLIEIHTAPESSTVLAEYKSTITARGEAMVTLLTQVPFPKLISRYIDPRTNEEVQNNR